MSDVKRTHLGTNYKMKRSNSIYIFFILSLPTFFSSGETSKFQAEGKNRRVLHQPFFPSVSSSPPPPPPPPPPDSSGQDQPFFHELPTGPVLDQGQQPPPPTPQGGGAAALSDPAAGPPSGPAKKVAIAAASVVLTLTMVAVMAFYLYKQRGIKPDEAQKLVAGYSMTGESRMPPPTPPASAFLYIGTVEPSNGSSANEASVASRSPYRKLNSGKRSERYRPSPELQPLPPLPKPVLPPRQNSPPPMSSSDDDNNFYTPQGSSSYSNESPVSRQNRVPHSKRTSPKSRLSSSSPDTKPVIIPSIKQSLPPSPKTPPPHAGSEQSKTLPYIPKRAGLKFSAPPPPPDISRLRSISVDDPQTSSVPIPPPPPPPPPPISAYTPPPVPKKLTRPESKSYRPISNPGTFNSSADTEDNDGSKPKLKPLHWDKVRATSDRATVWDQLKSSSFQLNEDAMESLFGFSSADSVRKEGTRKSALPFREQENRVLDPKKSQNIAILLRALNVTVEEISEALFDGNPEGLGLDLLESLVKMAPTKEEEIKLKDYNGEVSKLGSSERFLKVILDIPFAFKRVESMLYRANFDNEIVYLRKSFQTLEEASEELKNSRLFLKILEAVLKTGNRMNDGTNRGDAMSFKLDTLLKLVDIKGTDGKTTLLHFVVQEIIRSEGADSDPTNRANFKLQELKVVSELSKELANVKKAAGMDSDVLSGYVNKLEMGLEKVRSVIQLEKQMTRGEFFDSMKEFLNEAAEEINKIKAEERKALSRVKEVTEYFHGNAVKEEAHPFRIFVIVRDFLSVLDNVCKDVGRMQDRATVGAGRSFRMQTTSTLPVLNRYNVYHNEIFNN